MVSVRSCLLLVVVLPVVLISLVAAVSDKEVIHALRQQLEKATLLTTEGRYPETNHPKQHCTCEEYCTGMCFALQCGVCSPSEFSFMGGKDLCIASGPLGTGLLCHIDSSSGNVTSHPCCTVEGPTCFLPKHSCCSSGSCETCNVNSTVALFPTMEAMGKRVFNDSTNVCSDVEK